MFPNLTNCLFDFCPPGVKIARRARFFFSCNFGFKKQVPRTRGPLFVGANVPTRPFRTPALFFFFFRPGPDFAATESLTVGVNQGPFFFFQNSGSRTTIPAARGNTWPGDRSDHPVVP